MADQNAPAGFDATIARRLLTAVPRYERLPSGDYVKAVADQLRFATDAITSSDNRVANAQADAQTARRELDAAKNEVSALKKEIETLKAAPVEAPKRRGRPPKVVAMETERKAAQ